VHDLLRTELLKLTTVRAPWLLATSTVILAAVSAVLSVAGAGQRQAPSIGTTGAVLALLGGYGHGALLAMMFGALAVTTEYRHGTVTSTLLRTPRRVRPAVARALLVAAVTTGTGLLGLLACFGVAVAAGALGPGLLTGDLALRVVGLLAAYPAYGLVGLGVGMALPRHHAATALLPAAWVLLLEDLVFGLLTDHVPVWAVSRVAAAAANSLDAAPLLPVWAGLTGVAGYALAACALGVARFSRSDVP
jgi:ABC-2 type transport system permease protein